MPLVKNTLTGNNYLVKINTDADTCSRTGVRSYNKQIGANGLSGRTMFYLPFEYEPGSHTLWVFVDGKKIVVEVVPTNNTQCKEYSNKIVRFPNAVDPNSVLEFIVAGSYLNEDGTGTGGTGGGGGGGLTWILTGDSIALQNYFGYMANTSAGPLEFTLPASPVEGDTFAVVDALGTFSTNPATLHRSGKKIMGVAEDFVFNRDGMAIQFVYDGIDNWIAISEIGGSSGWRVITSATPSTDDEFIVCDFAGTFSTNNCIVARNGSRIMGLLENMNVDLNYATAKFVYSGSVQGWKVASISS